MNWLQTHSELNSVNIYLNVYVFVVRFTYRHTVFYKKINTIYVRPYILCIIYRYIIISIFFEHLNHIVTEGGDPLRV